MIRRALAVASVLTAAACGYSQQEVRVPDDRSAVTIANAPDDAWVQVDGRNMGTVDEFSDGRALRLEPGTHTVMISTANRILLSEKIFLGGGEVRTLKVTGDNQ